MTKKLKRVFSLFLAILMVASMPMSASAANYNNKATVSVSRTKNKTYNYSMNDSTWCGYLEVYKGNAIKRPHLTLGQSSAGKGVGTGKVRYMRVTITTSDNKTKTVQKKWELIKNQTYTKVTVTENGKVTSCEEYKGVKRFYAYQEITVYGTYGKSIKSIYASANYSGGSDPATYIYFKG